MPAPARGCVSTRPPSGGGWHASSARLGVRLFEAVDGVRKPTRQCEMVLAHVQAMAAHAAEIGRIGESLPGPVGRLRIASTNAVAEEVLSPRAGHVPAAKSGPYAAIPHLQRERQVLALGGRSRHPPAQARQGRFCDLEAGGRQAVFLRAC